MKVADAYWNHRHVLHEQRDRLLALSEAVDWRSDLTPYQFGQLLSCALEFKPDLILELGRGYGNSTCAFVEACHRLEACKVVSLCTSFGWERRTVPRLQRLVEAQWFGPLTALRQDILAWQPVQGLQGAKRVMVFWDAHGFEIASWVLGALLPALEGRSHVILMHDMQDARYSATAYPAAGIWRGGNSRGTQFYVDGILSSVEQAITVVDFANRNRIEVASPEAELRSRFEGAPEEKEMSNLLGPLFSLSAGWHWFTTEGCDDVKYPPFKSPGLSRRIRVALRQSAASLVSQRLYRR